MRYRLIAFKTPEGSPRCKECLPGNEVTHDCPGCGTLLKGGGLGRCRSCINRDKVMKDATFVAAQIEAPWCRNLWYGYVQESLSHGGSSPRLPEQIHRAAEFFRILDQRFESKDEIDTISLVQRMDSPILRLYLTASQYVVASLKLDGVVPARAAQVEERRVSSILDESDGQPHGPMLRAYAKWLEELGTAVRTGRLYLRAAESFCRYTSLNGSIPWQPSALVAYLKKTPGNAANLGRFVKYCRSQLGWNVEMPAKVLWHSTTSRTSRDLRELRAVLKSLDGREDASLTTQELARVLSLALGVSAAQLIRRKAAKGVNRYPDGSIEVEQDAIIDVSHPLHGLALRWADLADR